MPLLSASGGLIYHVRAMRHARTIWIPFREAIGAWLGEWQPSTDGLLLVGPSGGYTLPTEWLRRFDSIVAVDFDPLAPAMFSRRHRIAPRWIKNDVLPTGPDGIDFTPLRRLLDEYPSHAVLFSNVLGKLPRLLEGRRWASYHDRLSAERRPTIPPDRRHRNDRELAALAFGAGEVSSHSTERLGEGLACQTFPWQISPGYWHLIEACRATL